MKCQSKIDISNISNIKEIKLKHPEYKNITIPEGVVVNPLSKSEKDEIKNNLAEKYPDAARDLENW